MRKIAINEKLTVEKISTDGMTIEQVKSLIASGHHLKSSCPEHDLAILEQLYENIKPMGAEAKKLNKILLRENPELKHLDHTPKQKLKIIE